MRIPVLLGATAAVMLSTTAAQAKEITVRVDARSAPWSTSINHKLPFGLADARPASVVWDPGIRPGLKLTISASGQTTTAPGGGSFGPDGESDWPMDSGMALFPSHYMDRRHRPIYLNALVGAFVDADGAVVGKPFLIGSSAQVEVPEGAAALSMGINDDRYSDNTGILTVKIEIREAKVIVETGENQ